MTNYTEDTMDKLEEIIERAVVESPLLAVRQLAKDVCRRAVREALKLAMDVIWGHAVCDDRHQLMIEDLKALAATLEDK